LEILRTLRQGEHTLVGVLALCFLGLAGCGASQVAQAPSTISPEASLPKEGIYCPDEYLKWSLRWKGLEAATTELVTGAPGVIAGQDAIVVFSRTQSSELASVFREVSEEMTSQVSLETGRPLSNESLAVEEGEREHVVVTFGPEQGYTSKLSGNVKQHSWTTNGKSSDFHTFFARLRMWDGSPASGVQTFVQNGRSHYEVSLVKGIAKPISTILGKVPAIAIHGQAKRLYMDGKKSTDSDVLAFTLWRSDDGRFVPLRFDVETRLGSVRGTLVDVRASDSGVCLTAPTTP
tara:strand:- start:104136 stop:105008 length:873 start_codon:yes stop_codon:yes gene_type:complete